MPKHMPLSEPFISGNEWKYVKECLDSGWVSSAGEFVNSFAVSFAQYVHAKHAIPTTNGTSALHVSLVALGLMPDEEVIVPTLTFIATSNVVKYCNASPIFMDVDKETLCINTEKTIDFIEKECVWSNNHLVNKSTHRKVRGIIPVHLYGHPADMDPLMEIAKKYDLFVLEDATEALGAKYKSKMLGNESQISAFSFNGNKIITTGGGGMVATNDDRLAEKVRHLTTQARCDSMEYIHDEIGYNYRMTNIQAALGLAQLEKIEDYIKIKRHIASYYQEHFSSEMNLKVCKEKEWAFSTYWLSWLLIGDNFGKGKQEILKNLNDQNIQARPLFKPLHTLKPYGNCQTYMLELAEELYNSCINIPSHVTLTDEDLDCVIKVIKSLQAGK